MQLERIKLVVGLGNPGAKYERTRHNLGFTTVDAFLEKAGHARAEGRRKLGKERFSGQFLTLGETMKPHQRQKRFGVFGAVLAKADDLYEY